MRKIVNIDSSKNDNCNKLPKLKNKIDTKDMAPTTAIMVSYLIALSVRISLAPSKPEITPPDISKPEFTNIMNMTTNSKVRRKTEVIKFARI